MDLDGHGGQRTGESEADVSAGSLPLGTLWKLCNGV
jgi:hypothetical protein